MAKTLTEAPCVVEEHENWDKLVLLVRELLDEYEAAENTVIMDRCVGDAETKAAYDQLYARRKAIEELIGDGKTGSEERVNPGPS